MSASREWGRLVIPAPVNRALFCPPSVPLPRVPPVADTCCALCPYSCRLVNRRAAAHQHGDAGQTLRVATKHLIVPYSSHYVLCVLRYAKKKIDVYDSKRT